MQPNSLVTKPQRLLVFFNIFAFVISIVTNTLSIVLPLNGKSQMQLSAQYDNLFTPAGFTFSVWGIIYLFLAGFVIYSTIVLLKKQHPAKEKIIAVSPLFRSICLCNAGWLFAWHYEYVTLSVCIIFLYLILLIDIHETLQLALPSKPLQQKLWLDIPFSLNLGWICIAAIANVAAWFVKNRWSFNIFSESTWAVIMIIIGTLIALFYIIRRLNIFFGLIVIWALYGIEQKREVSGGEGSERIIWAASICMGILAAAVVINIFKRKKPAPAPLSFFQQ